MNRRADEKMTGRFAKAMTRQIDAPRERFLDSSMRGCHHEPMIPRWKGCAKGRMNG